MWPVSLQFLMTPAVLVKQKQRTLAQESVSKTEEREERRGEERRGEERRDKIHAAFTFKVFINLKIFCPRRLKR